MEIEEEEEALGFEGVDWGINNNKSEGDLLHPSFYEEKSKETLGGFDFTFSAPVYLFFVF